MNFSICNPSFLCHMSGKGKIKSEISFPDIFKNLNHDINNICCYLRNLNITLGLFPMQLYTSFTLTPNDKEIPLVLIEIPGE